MTEQMTAQEINEAIAVKRGWKFNPEGERAPSGGIYHYRDGWNRLKPSVPDYCNDWKYAGELLDEIIHKMNLTKIVVFLDEVDHHESEIFLKDDVYLTLNWHKSDNKRRKIALAWLEMHP
jgi:hypothetical protein